MHQLCTLAHPPVTEANRPYSRRDWDRQRQVEQESWTGYPLKEHRGNKLETSGHDTSQNKSLAMYVAIVAYGQSFLAPCKKSAQLGFYTVATTLEQVVLKP